MLQRLCAAVAAGWWCHVAVVGGLLAGASVAVAGAGAKPGPAATTPTGKDVFARTEVWQVHLTISAKEYEAMQPRRRGWLAGFAAGKPKPSDKPGEPARAVHPNNFGMDLPWARGSVTVDGQTFADVGIRYKGNGTIGDASGTIKKSLKIELGRFGGTARFGGVKTINLHCGVADPSKCRETLGYALYRAAGVPASRTALAEVWLTVPGKYAKELLGVYTVVEAVDRSLLRRHFGTEKGLLMKPEGLREFADLGDDWDRYKKQYVPKRDASKEEARRVIAFARLVAKADDATFRKEIGSYLDVDAYLRFLAVTAFVANPDSFFALGHNYYLYLHPRTGKLTFFPWDLDRAFANFPILGTNNQQMNLSLTHPYSGTHRLTERLLAVPELAAKYQQLLKELAASCFEKERLARELASAEAALKELRARDAKAARARKEKGPPENFGRPPEMRTFVDKRTASLAAQLARKSAGHVPGSGFGPGALRLGDFLAEPVLDKFDADKDGMLSKSEWVGAAKQLFAACKKDDHGRVDEKGLAAGLNALYPEPPDAGPGAFRPGNSLAGPILRRADANKDGTVTLEELVAAAAHLFDEFDKAKAGKLDEAALGEVFNALLTKLGPPTARPAAPTKEGKK